MVFFLESLKHTVCTCVLFVRVQNMHRRTRLYCTHILISLPISISTDTNSPAPDSLAATLPIIAILAILLIVAVGVSVIASKVKSHQTERKTSAKQKKRGSLPRTPPNRGRVDDENIYEKFNWENKISV